MKLTAIKMHYLLDIDEFEVDRFFDQIWEGNQSSKWKTGTDMIMDHCTFPDFELVETDTYYQWIVGYEFTNKPNSEEIEKLESLLIEAENKVNCLIRQPTTT